METHSIGLMQELLPLFSVIGIMENPTITKTERTAWRYIHLVNGTIIGVTINILLFVNRKVVKFLDNSLRTHYALTSHLFQKKIKVRFFLAKMGYLSILSINPNLIPPEIEIWGTYEGQISQK